MPNRTTRDYEGPQVAPQWQAALDVALQEEDHLELDLDGHPALHSNSKPRAKLKKDTKSKSRYGYYDYQGPQVALQWQAALDMALQEEDHLELDLDGHPALHSNSKPRAKLKKDSQGMTIIGRGC